MDHPAGCPTLLRLALLQALIEQHEVDKFYLSHLNYGGRGRRHSKQDAWYRMTRDAMTRLFDHCRAELERGVEREYVTGNNDADALALLHWARRRRCCWCRCRCGSVSTGCCCWRPSAC